VDGVVVTAEAVVAASVPEEVVPTGSPVRERFLPVVVVFERSLAMAEEEERPTESALVGSV